jgi:hypothetical protein
MNFFRTIGQNLPIVSALSSGAVLVGAFAFNQTEQWRMARQIQNGALSCLFPPDFSKKFCQFPLDRVRDTYHDDPDRFCGLIGLKATGKTTTLEYLASQERNCVFCEIDGNQPVAIDDVLYARLSESIWKLPWFFRQIRFNGDLTKRDIIREVFKLVEKNSKQKVLAVFDICATEKTSGIPRPPSIVNGVIQSEPVSFPTPSGFVTSLSSFDAEVFTRDVKNYVRDAKVMRCLFAASEGLSFLPESAREPRLSVFVAGELPLEISKAYLNDVLGVKMENENDFLLSQFPRTFSALKEFSKALNRKVFAETKFKGELEKAKQALKICNSVPFYQVALERPVGFDDYDGFCKMTKDQFVQTFVKTNLFLPDSGAEFKIQFDATREAIKVAIEQK